MTQTIILPAGARDAALSRLHAFLAALPADKAWRIDVAAHRRRRSDEQNRYLWGVVYKAVCEHLEGWSADDVHEYCLGECFGWETLEGLGKRRLRPVRRSSKLTTLEFADYIAFIQQRMAEHGIYIPDPNEQVA